MSQSQDIPILDIVVHYEIAGNPDAPALVLLHGNGEDLHIFDKQISYFSQFYRTIAIDTRGHGQSTRGIQQFNFHTFASDLTYVLEALHIEKAHIVGFSDGAIIALHAALSTPERVRSMVLLGANYHPKGLRLVPRFCIIVAYIWLLAASLFSKKMRKRWEIWGLMVWWPKLKLEYLSRINIPTLVVTGEKDMVSQRHNNKIHNAIVGSQRLVIPKGDHFWMRKQPELFQQHVVEFLQKHAHN